MILINGQPAETLSVMDRGLQYGDGLFETMAYNEGQLQFHTEHLSRLQSSCQRLHIHLDIDALKAELEWLVAQLDEPCVIKIIITRGQGGRGYKPATDLSATRIISTHCLPDYPQQNSTGVCVKICTTRLGIMPLLAGMKHLNRLEQVMASQELVERSDIAEGLMLDIEDNLVEGTVSNVFLIKQGQLFTPSLDKNGVAGIIRQRLINIAEANDLKVNITALSIKDLALADEVFICNSLFGIWPVTRITDTQMNFVYGPITKLLQQLLINAT